MVPPAPTPQPAAGSGRARPLLVAALIVRDEEALLPGCLASLEGLVDRIEVCDTGSTDGTVAIAEAAGADVSRFPWTNSFAEARNAVLARCTDARWVLQIDADERAECADPQALRRRLAEAEDGPGRLLVPMVNESGPDGGVSSEFAAERIFRATGFEYRNALHERLFPLPGTPDRPAAPLSGLLLRHLGYREDIVADKGKARRNIEVARGHYEAEPGPETALHYARSLLGEGSDPELCRRLLLEALDGGPTLTVAGRAYILGSLADLALRTGDPEEALRRAEEAVRLVPADDRAAAVHGRAAEALGRPGDVLALADWRRGRRSATAVYTGPAFSGGARSREVAALSALGRTAQAVRTARAVLADAPAAFDAWGPLASALWREQPSTAVARLAELAAVDPSGGAFAGCSRSMPPAAVAELCARTLQSGSAHPDAVRVGLIAALVAGETDPAPWQAHLGLLDRQTRAAMAERASARGAAALAEALVNGNDGSGETTTPTIRPGAGESTPEAPAASTEDGMASATAAADATSGPGAIPPIPARSRTPGLCSVVIPVWNLWELTQACLESLRAHTDAPLEIIVVDNGSTDATPAGLAAETAVTVITNAANRGFAAACNQGLAAATGEFVCVLNNDTQVTPGWLAQLRAALETPGTGMVGPRSNRISGVQMVPGSPGLDQAERAHRWAARWTRERAGRSWPVRRLVGFCLLARGTLFEAVGGFDEGFGLGNYEDDELCERVRAAGHTLRVADGAVVLHHGSATFAQMGRERALALLASNGRRFRRLAGNDGDLVTAVVLSAGQAEAACATAAASLQVADAAVILECEADAPTAVAAEPMAGAGVTVVAVDWRTPEAAEALGAITAGRVLVLAAGEQVQTEDWGAARAEIESLPVGPTEVLVGGRAEVRLHPPTPGALAAVGGQGPQRARLFAIT